MIDWGDEITCSVATTGLIGAPPTCPGASRIDLVVRAARP